MLFYFYLKQKYLSNIEYNRFKKSLMRCFMEVTENLFKRQLSSPQDSHNLVLKYCQDVIVPKYENVLLMLNTILKLWIQYLLKS